MEEPKLSFAALDARIEKLPQHPSHSTVMPKKARWGFAIGLGAAMLGLLAAKLLPSNQVYTVVVAGSFLIIELVGMGVALASQIPTSTLPECGALRLAQHRNGPAIPRCGLPAHAFSIRHLCG